MVCSGLTFQMMGRPCIRAFLLSSCTITQPLGGEGGQGNFGYYGRSIFVYIWQVLMDAAWHMPAEKKTSANRDLDIQTLAA